MLVFVIDVWLGLDEVEKSTRKALEMVHLSTVSTVHSESEDHQHTHASQQYIQKKLPRL